MTPAQLHQYDRFLDENDWDIYYWTTQSAPTTSTEYAEGGPSTLATPTAAGHPPSAAAETAAENTSVARATSPRGKSADVAAAAAAGQIGGAESQEASGQAAPQSESQMQGAGAGTGAPLGFGEGPVGEWAQTVGRVKEPYRPPPSRWRDSEILSMLRSHVEARKGGVMGGRPKGLGMMPDVRQF